MQCSRAARDTAAEHHHVHAVLAAQRLAMRPRPLDGEGRRGGDGGCVVGRGGWIREAQERSPLSIVFKILWLLTGLGACEPTGLFDQSAMLPHCPNQC